MVVPTHIQNLLDLQNISYQVMAPIVDDGAGTQTESNDALVRSLILKDGLGKVLALYPGDCLLDLVALNQHLVRHLRLATPDDVQPVLEQHQLDGVPGLPTLLGLPTVVDKRLLEKPQLQLHSGNGELRLEVGQHDFQQIIHDATICDFCVPLDTFEQPEAKDDYQQIFDSVRSFTSLRIKQRLEDTLELPPLPATAQRIIALRVDPNADINDLACIVETDPSLAAQVVSWAASPYYSAPGKIKSIHDAIVRVLGFDMVLNLALGLALGKALNMPKDGPYGVLPYWQQSVYTAAAVEGLVTAIPRDARPGFGIAYLAGLLHNFGYLVLAEVFPPYFELINRHIEVNPHVPAGVIEKHLIGISRDQLASWLMATWNMPEEVVIALRYQNSPNYSGDFAVYSKLLYTAQAKLRERSVGIGPLRKISPQMYDELRLDPQQADITIDNIIDSADELGIIAKQLAG